MKAFLVFYFAVIVAVGLVCSHFKLGVPISFLMGAVAGFALLFIFRPFRNL